MPQGRSNFEILVDAGVIEDPDSVSQAQKDIINNDLSHDEITHMVAAHAKLSSGDANSGSHTMCF